MAGEPAPLSPEQLADLYRTVVGPILFDDVPGGQAEPTLLLLGGQAGAGKSRLTGRILEQFDGMAALTGDDLRVFHPDYRTLITARPQQAGAVLAEATRAWVRSALDDAVDTRRSLLLEGSFGDPDVVLATAARFREAGFRVRVVAIASPRVLSLVSAASRYLRNVNAGNPARFTRLSAHDRGYLGTERLIDTVAATAPVDAVTVYSRNGQPLFDHTQPDGQGDANPYADAKAALQQGRHPESWGAVSTMGLLGELKQITGYATASGQLTPEIVELLEAAHEQALSDVVPNLSVATDSPQARFIQQAVTEQLVGLRRAGNENRPDLETVSGVSTAGPQIQPA